MAHRLVFMGTPEFAVPSLTALVAAGHDVISVYTQPPRPAGRGKKPRATPVQAAADQHGIAVRTPETLRAAEEQDVLSALGADAIVVVAYGLILPKAVLDMPRLGCLNVHASLLPRWRGAAPIQRALLAGDTETGISIMVLDEGLDTGPVVLQHAIDIAPGETAGTLHDRLADLGAALIVKALAGVSDGRLAATDQRDEGATYARKIARSEAEIDWGRSAEDIDRQVRALAPSPGAWFRHGAERVKVFACMITAGESGNPGEVLDGRLTIACGAGALRLQRLQREGRKAMDADAFLRGQALPPGTQLG